MIFPGKIYEFGKSIPLEKLQLAFGLVGLNVICYFFVSMMYPDSSSLRSSLEKLNNPNLLNVMQSMYLQSVDPIVLPETERNLKTNPYVFLYDLRFWKRVDQFHFTGDEYQIVKAREVLKNIESIYLKSPQYRLGLSEEGLQYNRWGSLITYQVLHVSFMHLLLNCIFLFLIVSLLEGLVSNISILAVYILGGIGGGVLYLLIGSENSFALVGASGSISALMMFLVVISGRKNIPWSYWLSPQPGSYGTIYLPAFLIFTVFLLSDFSAVFISGIDLKDTISFSAHVGGSITGLLIGAGLKYSKYKILNQDDIRVNI